MQYKQSKVNTQNQSNMSHNLKYKEIEINELLIKVSELSFLISELKEKLEKYEDLEDRINKLEQFNSYIKGTVIGVTAVFSFLMSFGLEAIKRIFS